MSHFWNLPLELKYMILEYLKYLLVQDYALRPHFEERIVGRVYARRSKNIIAKLPFLPQAHRFSTSLLRVNKYWYEKGCRALYSMNVFEFHTATRQPGAPIILPVRGKPAIMPRMSANAFATFIGSANVNRIHNVPGVDCHYPPDLDMFNSIMDTFTNLETLTMRYRIGLEELVKLICGRPTSKLHTLQVLDRELMYYYKLPRLEHILEEFGWKFSHQVVGSTEEMLVNNSLIW